jgi:hypothetical protein
VPVTLVICWSNVDGASDPADSVATSSHDFSARRYEGIRGTKASKIEYREEARRFGSRMGFRRGAADFAHIRNDLFVPYALDSHNSNSAFATRNRSDLRISRYSGQAGGPDIT